MVFTPPALRHETQSGPIGAKKVTLSPAWSFRRGGTLLGAPRCAGDNTQDFTFTILRPEVLPSAEVDLK